MPIDTTRAFSRVSTFALTAAATAQLPPHEAELVFDWGFDLVGPHDMLGVFARDLDTAAPLSRLPIYGVVRFRFGAVTRARLERGQVELEDRLPSVPLGVVGTDHVGYASFDLSPVFQTHVMQSIRLVLEGSGLLAGERPTVEVGQILVMPFKDPSFAFDALSEGDLGSDFIALRMDLDATMRANRAEWPPMPAMQTPGIRDWRLSPGSFSMAGALLIGEDGCETLLPSNLATRVVRFRQLVRTPRTATATLRDRSEHTIPGLSARFTGDVRLGFSIEYNTEWFPLGHSLGQLSYSLPLAPGEKMQIAVVDWSRRELAKRTEQTTVKEDLEHAALRDRNLTEMVNMVVQESQRGSSMTAGGALSAGAGIPIGPVSLGIGAAGGVAGGSAETEGMRSLIGNTSQTISDAFHQASSASRELNSTVVVQGSQAESAEAKTRVVANYNHSHALTILYYEVLQHHRALTRATSVRPVLMLDHEPINFDPELIDAHRAPISEQLLDESVRAGLDVAATLAKLQAKADRAKAKADAAPLPQGHKVGEFVVDFICGAQGPAAPVHVKVIPKSGPSVLCDVVDTTLAADLNGTMYRNAISAVHIPNNAGTTVTLRPRNYALRWSNVQAIEIHQGTVANEKLTFSKAVSWNLKELRISTTSGGDTWHMIATTAPTEIDIWGTPFRFDVAPFAKPAPVIPDPMDSLSDDDYGSLDRLLDHLNAHTAHYWRAIWRAETATDRSVRLDDWLIGGTSLLDVVDNRVYDVAGRSVVMPVAASVGDATKHILERAFGAEGILRTPILNDYVEQLLTLPARGVFAEAKLGSCNASEIIDPSRFWDWQTSPIPDSPPAILPINTEGKAQDITSATAPTAFPSSLVNIVNPQPLPDPTGFSTASGILSALGAFKDMSGKEQAAAVLQTLSNNATKLASQGMDAAQIAGLVTTIRNAKELTPEQRSTLIGELLTGEVKKPGPTPPAPTSADPAKPTPTKNGAPEKATTPEKPVPTPSPAPPTPVGTPRPPEPTPRRATSTSKKTKKLAFSFRFDTRDPMLGTWNVTLQSGGEFRDSKGFTINTIREVSGRAVGNRVEMDFDAAFGGSDNVEVQISGTIVGLPQVLSSDGQEWSIQPWDEPRTFVATIPRAQFDKTQTIEVIKETEPVTFTVSRTQQGGRSETKVTGHSAGAEIGVESQTEVGGTVGVATAKEAVKLSAKGTYGWKSENQSMESTTEGESRQVVFTGRRLTAAQPVIAPVL